MEPVFHGRLGIQQRVLPAYRAALFDALAARCSAGLGVYAGQPQEQESIAVADRLQVARLTGGRNRYFQRVESPLCLVWQPGLVAWLEAWDPNVLIVEANSRYISVRQATRWMHAHGRPVIGWGLGAPPLKGPLAGIRTRERRSFLLSLDGLIAYSPRGAEEYCALGIPAGQIFVARNAVSTRPSGQQPERPLPFTGPPVVLFVGRLQARKRIDLLLHACAALPPGLQPRLKIVGDGPASEEFRSLSQHVYPRAEFLGARRGADLADLFRTADLFVLPGTGGLAVQEAMSYALPVIVAEGDGTQDTLVRPENGWLVQPGEVASLAAALRAALSDPARLRRMGAEAYRIIQEEVNLEQMTDVFIQAINQVQASPQTAREAF